MLQVKQLWIIFFLIISLIQAHSDSRIPQLKNSIVNIQDLVKFIGDGQLFVIFPQKDMFLRVRETENKENFETRFVSSISIIKASPETVKKVINDYDHYSEFMPQNDSSEIIERTTDFVIARYSVFVKLPVVFKIHATFNLKHRLNDQGDITWALVDGKMKASLGRWEIIPISKEQTLVINTSWSDHKSIGFFSRMLIKAQPDLAMAIPIGTTALMLEAVKRRAENKKRDQPQKAENLSTSPQIPYISTQTIPYHTLNALLKKGKLLLVHPRQWIKSSDQMPLDFVFTSGIDVVNSSFEQVKNISTDIADYPDIFYQVKSVKQRIKPLEKEIDWYLKLWFSFFSFKINLTHHYFWESENILTFTREKGDLEYVFGRREWISLSPKKTMLVFTTAFQGGKTAPLLINFINMLPNSQVIGSTSVCSVLMDKHIPWIEKQLNIER
jgi:ribosome-associated toxin RatA of RatAB toxin-antitoxin module